MLGVFKTKENFFYALAIIVYSLLYAMARFPGLESHNGYFGMAYALIHPESFSGDIAAGYHPAMISWYSLLVKLAGDLWLDDRFNVVVYFILTLLSFWAMDRIIKVCGVKNKLLRLTVIAIVVAFHTFICNVTRLMDTVCYRPSTYAYPVGLWLGYFLLKDRKFNMVLLFSFLLITVSLKNGWFAALAAVLIVTQEKFQLKWSRIIVFLLVVLMVLFAGNYFYLLEKGKLVENALLFDLTLATTENEEASPVRNGLGPFFYVLLLLLAIRLNIFKDQVLENKIKALWTISLVVYLTASVYYTFAPDFLKVPFFVALAVSRSTWFTQILLFAMFSIYFLQKMTMVSLKKDAGWFFLLFILYIFPLLDYPSMLNYFQTGKLAFSKEIVQRIVVYGTLLFGMLVLYALSQKGFFKQRLSFLTIKPWAVVMLPFIVTACVSVVYKLYSRWPDLAFMCRYGIVGGTEGAQWVGMNEFIREHTDPKSSILAFVGPDLKVDTALRIRTGRTMPLASCQIAFYFDYPKQLKQINMLKETENFSRHWRNRDVAALKRDLKMLNDPDYLIIPSIHEWNTKDLGYESWKEINSFRIYRKAN